MTVLGINVMNIESGKQEKLFDSHGQRCRVGFAGQTRGTHVRVFTHKASLTRLV